MQDLDQTTHLLYVPNHIRFCSAHGRIILINLNEGDYSILDEVATFLWNLVCLNLTIKKAAIEFAEHFAIPEALAYRDLMEFINDCIYRRLLITYGDPIIPITPILIQSRRMTLLNAFLSLHRIKKSLRGQGFSETYRWHLRLQFSGSLLKAPKADMISNALAMFKYAENGFRIGTSDIDCLPRSLALYSYLLAGGIRVDHCIGVRRFPFGAHAWVELCGAPIYDSPDFVKQFTLISKMTP
uniref:lasso peptide biosynthesis B2 protein n=1 Tax=Pedobacter sp. TaxID=1411316 RepID=UPI00159B694E|nr:lasso peptide biosynthesis B2 protein [Pedobacter sp.]QJS06272.1 Coenzyme PQQ synthesis protein D [Pedobacter sp.]